jgi:hypothetical protein
LNTHYISDTETDKLRTHIYLNYTVYTCINNGEKNSNKCILLIHATFNLAIRTNIIIKIIVRVRIPTMIIKSKIVLYFIKFPRKKKISQIR